MYVCLSSRLRLSPLTIFYTTSAVRYDPSKCHKGVTSTLVFSHFRRFYYNFGIDVRMPLISFARNTANYCLHYTSSSL
jgi:hypothetical protein